MTSGSYSTSTFCGRFHVQPDNDFIPNEIISLAFINNIEIEAHDVELGFQSSPVGDVRLHVAVFVFFFQGLKNELLNQFAHVHRVASLVGDNSVSLGGDTHYS